MESDPERPSDPVVAYFVSRIPRLRRCNSLQPVGPSHTSSMGGKQAALAASNSPDRPDGCSETKTLIRLVRDQDALLDLCDQVRECIREDGQLGPRAQTFTSVLRFMLDRESTLAGPAIPLRTIRTTHLDKLLTEVVAATDGASSKSLQVNAAVAEALQSRWRARFRAAYFCLDHERRKGLLGGGDSPPPSPGDARRRDRPKSRVPKVGQSVLLQLPPSLMYTLHAQQS